MNNPIDLIQIQKERTNKGSKAFFFKETLRQIPVGDKVILDHKKHYCTGWGQRCTLAHYVYLLKRRGEGEWEVKHSEPGIAEVTRIK